MQMQFGEETAIDAANRAEYIWNRDPETDPFAPLYGKTQDCKETREKCYLTMALIRFHDYLQGEKQCTIYIRS